MKTRPEIQISCKVEQSPLTFTCTLYLGWSCNSTQIRKFPISNVQSHCFFIISHMLPLFGLHMLKTKTCVSQDNKNCFEKQLLLSECNFVFATMFPGFHQPSNVHGSNHCLELIFSFEDTKFKVDHKLSHSSVRRYVRFCQFHLNHIGKVRLFAILHCTKDFQIEFG